MRAAATLLVIGLAATDHSAWAGGNDIVLARLGTILEDSTGTAVDVAPRHQDFRSMVSELGVVLAPRLMTPADTLGFGGFHFSFMVDWTQINHEAPYWRVLRSSNAPDSDQSGFSHGPGYLPAFSAFVRKGLLASTEVGLGVTRVLDSQLWAAQGYFKVALLEGYPGLPMPSLAVRGASSRAMGSNDLDLTIASLDVTASKAFGIGGAVAVEPFGGWNHLWIVARSEVVDKTPHIADDAQMNFVFPDQDTIRRHRFFGGVKVRHHVFALTLEADLSLAGATQDDQTGVDRQCSDAIGTLAPCDADDDSITQKSFQVSLAMDF